MLSDHVWTAPPYFSVLKMRVHFIGCPKFWKAWPPLPFPGNIPHWAINNTNTYVVNQSINVRRLYCARRSKRTDICETSILATHNVLREPGQEKDRQQKQELTLIAQPYWYIDTILNQYSTNMEYCAYIGHGQDITIVFWHHANIGKWCIPDI